MKKVLLLVAVSILILTGGAFAAEPTATSTPLLSIGLWPMLTIPGPWDENAGLFSVGGGAELSA